MLKEIRGKSAAPKSALYGCRPGAAARIAAPMPSPLYAGKNERPLRLLRDCRNAPASPFPMRIKMLSFAIICKKSLTPIPQNAIII